MELAPLHRFQFLGIPPKGELLNNPRDIFDSETFPISRDPPEGGTTDSPGSSVQLLGVSNF